MSTPETFPPTGEQKAGKNIDELCGQPNGTFENFIKSSILVEQIADQNKTLRTRLAEVEKELAGISAALDKEFGPQDTRSGDLLDDMGCFIDHHKAKEKELTQLKEANAELAKDKDRLEFAIRNWATFNRMVFGKSHDPNHVRNEIDAAIAKGKQ